MANNCFIHSLLFEFKNSRHSTRSSTIRTLEEVGRGPSASPPRRTRDRHASWHVWLTIIPPHPPAFCKSIILNMVKVLCFDRLLQVLILRDLGARRDRGLNRLGGNGKSKSESGKWGERDGRRRF